MDIEGTIQFIINQQAQFVADIHSFQESQRVLGEKIDKLYDTVGKLSEVVMHHEDAHVVTYGMIDKLAARLDDLVERQGWLFDGHKLLIESQQRLSKAQIRSETKGDKLADKIDLFIDEVRKNVTGRNGGAEN